MRKFLAVALAALVAVGTALTPQVEAQVPVVVLDVQGQGVSGFQGALDTESIILIRYVGTAATSALVASETDGNLTFTVDGSAVTEFECPVSGGLGGVIDVSDAACNTWGEVVDVINASTSWRAVLTSGLASDSSNNVSLAVAAATAKKPGIAIFRDDTNTSAGQAILLQPSGYASEAAFTDFFFTDANKLIPNPWDGYRTFVTNIYERITNAGTIGQFDVQACRAEYTGPSRKVSETCRSIFNVAGASTTNATSVNFFAGTPGYVVAEPGERVIVRIGASGAATSVVLLSGNGVMVRGKDNRPRSSNP